MKSFFEGIQYLAETILFAPFNLLREMELENWWTANIMSWLFLLIGFVAMLYWMKQLSIFNANGEEDRSSTSHSYLG